MLVFLTRRLAASAAVLVAISFLSFWVFASHIDPLVSLKMSQPYPREKIARVTARAHLDESIPARYAHWLAGMVAGGDAGHTIITDDSIWPPVWQSLKLSVQLLAATLVVVVLFSVALGVISAYRPGSPADTAVRGLGYLLWSVPVFVLALGLQQAVYHLAGTYHFQPLPPTGRPGGSGLHYVADWFRHMTLPVLTLSATYIGAHSRFVRSSMLVSLAAPYSTVARAKGLAERRIVVRHALRTSLIPFVAVLALDFGALFGGSFVVDVVFRLGGLGSLWIGAVAGYDPYQIEAVLLVTAATVALFSLLADVAIGRLDPRVRLA